MLLFCAIRRRREDMNEKEKDCFKMILDQIFDRMHGGPSSSGQDIGQRGLPALTDGGSVAPRPGGWETYRNAQFCAKGGGKSGKSWKRGNPGKGGKGGKGSKRGGPPRGPQKRERFHRGTRAGRKRGAPDRSMSAKMPHGSSPDRYRRRSRSSSPRGRRSPSSSSSSSSYSSGIHTPVLVLRSKSNAE